MVIQTRGIDITINLRNNIMTVKELKEMLNVLPDDADVWIYVGEKCVPLDEVRYDIEHNEVDLK